MWVFCGIKCVKMITRKRRACECNIFFTENFILTESNEREQHQMSIIFSVTSHTNKPA